MKTFYVVESNEVKNWDYFVYNHPHGNIFQTTEMRRVFEYSNKSEPISIAVIDNGGEIFALMQAVILRDFPGFLGSFSSRSVIQGGPLFIDGDYGKKACAMLLDAYNEIVEKKVVYSQVRNMSNTSEISNIFKKRDYNYIEHLNFLINLNQTIENIWADIHKSRRKGINRFEKNGVTIELITEKTNIKIFYDIVNETYKKVKLPVDDFSIFESVFNILVPKKMAQFYLAKYEDKYIGARAILNFKDLVYDWYAGSLPNYESFYINEGLVWHILKENANIGYHNFDFGGAGSPNEEYGVREFKKRFGGKMVNYGRYTKIHSPTKMFLAKQGFKIYRELKL